MTNKLYKLMNWPKIEEIIYSESNNPHELLGPHRTGTQTLIQAYFPDAVKVEIKWDKKSKDKESFAHSTKMELADDDGYFAVLVPEKELPAYSYQVTYEDGHKQQFGEPYRYAPQISEKDIVKFNNGIHYTIY